MTMTIEEAAEVLLDNKPWIPCTCGLMGNDYNGEPILYWGKDEDGSDCKHCIGDGEVVNPRHVEALSVLGTLDPRVAQRIELLRSKTHDT